MSRELPAPWGEFLSEIDGALEAPVTLHCLGGFVGAICYGLARTTNDLDYLEIAPMSARTALERLAGRQSALARKHGVYVQHFSLVTLPDSYADRLTDLVAGRFRRLRLRALEAHDLALSKLSRDSPVDREDVAHLARTVPLDPELLRRRYRHELRPIAIGDPALLDQRLERWIAAYFPGGDSASVG
ncbi:MAG: DUF6036 family nucleotidyltransferase [Candidatus Rokuibacteriota bacterium]